MTSLTIPPDTSLEIHLGQSSSPFLARRKTGASAGQIPNAEACFQAVTTAVNGMIGTLVYHNSRLGDIWHLRQRRADRRPGMTGTANITVFGGVSEVAAILNPGINYVVGDTLSASSGNIGGATGLSVPVASISINSSLAGGSVGSISRNLNGQTDLAGRGPDHPGTRTR